MGKLFLASNFYLIASQVAEILQNKQQGEKVLFITTAAEAEEGDKSWLEDDKNALKHIGLEPIAYTITGKTKDDFVKDCKDINYIFISGGNTFYLLEKAQKSGFMTFIKSYMEDENHVYFGSSAGAAIVGADIYPLINLDDVKKAPDLKGYQGFKLIDVCLLPHWGSEHFKNRYLNHRLDHAYGDMYKLMMLTDKQFLYVTENGFYKILASKK